MPEPAAFRKEIKDGYAFEGASVVLGGAMFDGTTCGDLLIRAPLRTFNRHGLIAGATGTGKTKTFQHIAGALSSAGIPVLLMDIKGDLSGLAAEGKKDERIDQRHTGIGVPWTPQRYPVEFLTISGERGVRLRSTISEFGPVLFSKILELNDTQAGVVSLVFKYCDDHQYPLVDLKDFKKVLQFLTNEGKEEIERDYGRINTATTGLLIRKIVEIEQEGADAFFGEPSFDIQDLLRIDERGYGYLNILRLSDIQNKPRMFSTFMLSMLAEIYSSFPEEGDLEQPKLVIFFDEAHLIFQEASKGLLEQLETIIKLIRSKGVGVFFCTQSPTDIPAVVLSQLGMKIQHSLRAFTALDRKSIKLASENYPTTEFYNTDQLMTAMGIGEALVTLLNDRGVPTPLVHTMMCAPASRMGTLSDGEITDGISRSTLVTKYASAVDPQSAYEILSAKLLEAAAQRPVESPGRVPDQRTTFEKVVSSPISRQVGTVIARELTRWLLGVLGLGGRSRRPRLF
jgi:hypothetical protein